MTKWLDTIDRVSKTTAKHRLTYIGSPKPQLADHIHNNPTTSSHDSRAGKVQCSARLKIHIWHWAHISAPTWDREWRWPVRHNSFHNWTTLVWDRVEGPNRCGQRLAVVTFEVRTVLVLRRFKVLKSSLTSSSEISADAKGETSAGVATCLGK